MSAMTSQITGVSFICSTVGSGADQRKHESSASLAFVRGIHRWPVNSPHKRRVTRSKCFHHYDPSLEQQITRWSFQPIRSRLSHGRSLTFVSWTDPWMSRSAPWLVWYLVGGFQTGIHPAWPLRPQNPIPGHSWPTERPGGSAWAWSRRNIGIWKIGCTASKLSTSKQANSPGSMPNKHLSDA